MTMNMHDRYYEPADDDYEDMDGYIEDYVRFEMRKGGDLDPTNNANFLEAMSQLGLRDEEQVDCWNDATAEEQEKVIEYWEGVARYLGEESYFSNL